MVSVQREAPGKRNFDAAVGQAGERISGELKRIYNGDVEAAEGAVQQLVSEPKALEAWATRMLRNEPMPKRGDRMPDTGPGCRPFSFDELPGGADANPAAVRGMAMAYLVATTRENP